MTAPSPWLAGVHAVQQEAGGVMSLTVVQPNEMADVVADAVNGDPEAYRLLKAMSHAARGILAAEKTRRPMLCASCPRPVKPPRLAFVVVTPACDDPSSLLTLAVCRRCATSRQDVEKKARTALLRLWPDLRSISVHPTAGSA